jgi:hypothetical protein
MDNKVYESIIRLLVNIFDITITGGFGHNGATSGDGGNDSRGANQNGPGHGMNGARRSMRFLLRLQWVTLRVANVIQRL